MGRGLRWHGSHTHTGGEQIDERFLDCPICHGRGATTCEKCGGAGRIVMRDGIQVGTLTRPATQPILGPNPKRIRS